MLTTKESEDIYQVLADLYHKLVDIGNTPEEAAYVIDSTLQEARHKSHDRTVDESGEDTKGHVLC